MKADVVWLGREWYSFIDGYTPAISSGIRDICDYTEDILRSHLESGQEIAWSVIDDPKKSGHKKLRAVCVQGAQRKLSKSDAI